VRAGLRLTEQVVELYKSKLCVDYPDTLGSMHSLANRHSQAGRRPEALRLTEPVVELRKSKLSEDHPDTFGVDKEASYLYLGKV
jgi:Tetratricopeptide repeat